MAKAKTVFICKQCGYESGRWMGKCPSCGEWNTMEEEQAFTGSASAKKDYVKRTAHIVRMNEIDLAPTPHQPIGIGELDRVLGGGLVEGAVVLVGGEPGVGKSTLLLQACELVAQTGRTVLYVSGEESARQVKMRARRLGTTADALYMLAETDMDAICEAVAQQSAPLVVIDSIQTMHKQGVSSSMGSVLAGARVRVRSAAQH